MIKLSEIRKDLVNKLQDYLDITVILGNPDGPKPEEPFVVLNFTSPYVPSGSYAEETEDAEDCYVKTTRTSWDTMVASISVYADDELETALQALEYFLFYGHEELRQAGLVVIETTALQNRDVYVIDHWERKTGFDVTFRVVSHLEDYQHSIQTISKEEK